MDILTHPAFPGGQAPASEREPRWSSIQNRNQNVFDRGRADLRSDLVYGEDSPITAEQTEAIVNAFTTPGSCRPGTGRYWGANNAMLVDRR